MNPTPSMNRTPRKKAFDSGLVYTDPDYQDAYELIESDIFFASTRETELEPIVCTAPIASVLSEHCEAAAAYEPLAARRNEMHELCRSKDGLIHGQFDLQGRFHYNPIIEHFEKQMWPIEEAYWKSLDRLNDALTVETLVCIKVALNLAGITDAALMDEICRCVIRGGELFDGGNLQQRELMYGKQPQLIVSAPAIIESVACPHCTLPNEPGDARCFACERLIG